MHQVDPLVERRTTKTEVEIVRNPPDGVDPMHTEMRAFLPQRVFLRYTNWHDGEGWHLSGIVSGGWILKDGTVGVRQESFFFDFTTDVPQWLADIIAETMPPDHFDIGKKIPVQREQEGQSGPGADKTTAGAHIDPGRLTMEGSYPTDEGPCQ